MQYEIAESPALLACCYAFWLVTQVIDDRDRIATPIGYNDLSARYVIIDAFRHLPDIDAVNDFSQSGIDN